MYTYIHIYIHTHVCLCGHRHTSFAHMVPDTESVLTFAPTPHFLCFYLYNHWCFNQARRLFNLLARAQSFGMEALWREGSLCGGHPGNRFWSPFGWCPELAHAGCWGLTSGLGWKSVTVGASRGVQPFGVSGPHWKKNCCLGPHIKHTNTNESWWAIKKSVHNFCDIRHHM